MADLKDADSGAMRNRVDARRIARAIPLASTQKSESRVTAKPRNAAKEMRFPAS